LDHKYLVRGARRIWIDSSGQFIVDRVDFADFLVRARFFSGAPGSCCWKIEHRSRFAKIDCLGNDRRHHVVGLLLLTRPMVCGLRPRDAGDRHQEHSDRETERPTNRFARCDY
jgi:hypothetical protein